MKKQIVLGITGASGALYAQRLARELAALPIHLHIIATGPGRSLLIEELGIDRVTIASLVGDDRENVTLYKPSEIGAQPASGSFRTHGMVVCPCSSHTLAAIATGLANNLVTRAALVTMKESRKLILVPREMPLSAIELGNMHRLALAGAVICPACPGFYMRPTSIDDLIQFVVARVLDLLDLDHAMNVRWDPNAHAASRRFSSDPDE